MTPCTQQTWFIFVA